MILVTVGSQLPFDRLTRAVDLWCAQTGRKDVFGQIAVSGNEGYRPANFKWQAFLHPAEFRDLLEDAELIVAHAGMGSIISALHKAKPIIVMPRRAAFRETRNDHQVATAKRLRGRPGVFVADNEGELVAELGRLVATGARLSPIPPYADPQLIAGIRKFISG